MEKVKRELEQIVGPEYVSDAAEELFIYSRDQGTMEPGFPDLVVLPGTVDEIQQIVRLATEKKIPVVPLGGGLVLSGLSRALRGGIVLDLKRLNRILEVDELNRFALVEAGASQGMLQAFLAKNHPTLKHSIPDAPPIATLAGNVLIHGSGHLSHMAGFHTDMLGGLEVVLPTGEKARVGSPSVSPYWFGRAPLPDLAGMFLGWAGTTGIVTKLAVKLFPKRRFSDVEIFVIDDPDLGPEVINRMTWVGQGEDLTAWMTPKPDWADGLLHFNLVYGADSEDELAFKRKLIKSSVRHLIDRRVAGFMVLPTPMKKRFLEEPATTLTRFADVRQGGGFEYVGGIMPIGLFGQAYRAGLDIARGSDVAWSMGCRVIGQGHAMMFFYAYAFNRADAADVDRAKEALERTNEAVLELGGIPWKAEAPAQRRILDKMDPGAIELMNRLRRAVDPAGIMNPGNWEAS
ncbi:MAG: FAD-binding oxidoreductase [Proteobacteria bacterium]|nr:FAD-binding oxidoreductase [Pseudomonadota bacterium]